MKRIGMGLASTALLWAFPVSEVRAVCGIVMHMTCPGCTPSSPTDSTCFCGVNGQQCDCIKQSGGRQTGIILEAIPKPGHL